MPQPFTKDQLINIRRELHQQAELSGNEKETASIISKLLDRCGPDSLHTELGGHGILASFYADDSAEKEASSILFRAELDAIPVHEQADREYRSRKSGVMHGCGHDGHMSILLGLASYVGSFRPASANIHILFQPAEETGEGAERILEEALLNDLKIDTGYALHNIPGFEEGDVLLKPGIFAVASSGLEIDIIGKSSHAAEPEKGVNPSGAVAEILYRIEKEAEPFLKESATQKIACTYIRMGDRAFGVSPGQANIGYTLRAGSDERLHDILCSIEDSLLELNQDSEIDILSRRVEPFRSTVNDSKGVLQIKKACDLKGIPMVELDTPFLWSEDFGRFAEQFPIVLFGLGAGTDSEPLHSENYDFNENLIERGVEVFKAIIDTYSRK
ncbi:MAG: amidohydrolase [Bacteroidetes bacterium]|jgi:amidohydrolase|nr:amidohydrolase [Bacteroidota bacterium]